MSNIQLRKGGIYVLPNGREFILSVGERGSHLFHSLEDKTKNSSGSYYLSRDGRIYYQGMRTNWSAEHITDTGRMA